MVILFGTRWNLCDICEVECCIAIVNKMYAICGTLKKSPEGVRDMVNKGKFKRLLKGV